MAASVQPNTGAAFLGGAQKRHLLPPNVAAAIAPAQTGVNSPVGGVTPSPLKRARNNEGSNIGIPYSRLVPLESPQNALTASPVDPTNPKKQVTETEDLKATRLAWIFGVRGAGARTDPEDPKKVLTSQTGTRGRKVMGDDNRTLYGGASTGFYSSMMSGHGGPMQLQQLASTEFVRSYFANVLATEVVSLSLTQEGAHRSITDRARLSGRIGSFEIAKRQAEDRGLNILTGGRPEQPPNLSTLTRMQDVAHQLSLTGGDARQVTDAGGFAEPRRLQGIFHMGFGPFLRGKGAKSETVFGTPHNHPQLPSGATPADPDLPPKQIQPFTMSRNAGDELAFAYLDALLLEHGIVDFVPDGICLSLGDDIPQDKLEDEFIKSRDSQLYNIRVAGPALSTTWTGEPALEVQTLSVCYVAVICDVWFSVRDPANTVEIDDPRSTGGKRNVTLSTVLGTKAPAAGEEKAARDDRLAAARITGDPSGQSTTTQEMHADYLRIREDALKQTWDECAFRDAQANAFDDTDVDDKEVVCTNFRLVLTNSEQMTTYSAYKPRSGPVASSSGRGERHALANASRLGLRLSNRMGEYICGAHRIGNVLDTKASRGAMPSGNIGVRTALGSAALNLNVGISWETANRLSHQYGNTEGLVTGRHQATRSDVDLGPRSNPKYATAIAYAEVAVAEAEERKQQAADALEAGEGVLAKARAEMDAAEGDDGKKAAKPAVDAAQAAVGVLKTCTDGRDAFVTQRRATLEAAKKEAEAHNKAYIESKTAGAPRPGPPPNKPAVAPSRTAGLGDPTPPPPLNRPRKTRAP